MRKMTVHINPNHSFPHFKTVLKMIERIDLLHNVHMDFGDLTELNIVKVKFREGTDLKVIDKFPSVKVVGVLEKISDREFVCLIKKQIPAEMAPLMENFKLDLIYENPCYFTPHELVYSCVGDEENLNKFLDAAKLMGDITKVTYKKHSYNAHGMLTHLTEKQRAIFLTARELGYYKYPREISTEELAEKIKVKKSTLIEHLRRIENNIFSNL